MAMPMRDGEEPRRVVGEGGGREGRPGPAWGEWRRLAEEWECGAEERVEDLKGCMALMEGRRIGNAWAPLGEGKGASWLLPDALLSNEFGRERMGRDDEEGVPAVLGGLAGRTNRSARFVPGGERGRLARMGGVCWRVVRVGVNPSSS